MLRRLFFCLRLRFFGGDFGAALRNTEVILGFDCIICIRIAYMQWEIFSYVSSETLYSKKINSLGPFKMDYA